MDVVTTAERVAEGREQILAELRKVIVGQDEVVEEVLIALFTGGHCLITGVPGLAKTLLIKTLADILDLDFKRIQFTPDIMPSDITGTEILDEQEGTRRLRFVKGPIFAQIILADEINRTPPKTQAALLEAMQEYHVTAAGRTYPLERPFFVLATQNPIELEGTYPLPEAQLDRFMFNVVIRYLNEDDEVTVVTQTTGGVQPVGDTIVISLERSKCIQTVRRQAESVGWEHCLSGK
jgi:MoxR-like ATPase